MQAQDLIIADTIETKREFPHYLKLDVSTPLRENPYRDEIDPVTGETGYWYVPDGISARIGIGYNFRDFFTIGATTGIDWKAAHAIVTVPVFAEARLSPLVGDDLRLYLAGGYGRAFAIGRGNLSGEFQMYRLGLGNDEGSYFFVEFAIYGFTIHEMPRYGSISLGISFGF